MPSTRPAARPGPGVIGQLDGLAKDLLLVALEKGPGDDQIAGRIADGASPEVDDRGKLPSSVSRFSTATSPCTQTGEVCHADRVASNQIASHARPSM